jgi:hypothetical protein
VLVESQPFGSAITAGGGIDHFDLSHHQRRLHQTHESSPCAEAPVQHQNASRAEVPAGATFFDLLIEYTRLFRFHQRLPNVA